jgi:hypothetical protein
VRLWEWILAKSSRQCFDRGADAVMAAVPSIAEAKKSSLEEFNQTLRMAAFV